MDGGEQPNNYNSMGHMKIFIMSIQELVKEAA